LPLGLAANMGVPGISPAVAQAQQMGAAAANSIPQLGALNAQMGNAGMILGGVAALGALAAERQIATSLGLDYDDQVFGNVFSCCY